MNKLYLSLMIVVILSLSQPLHADTLDKIKFLKVSEPEGKAVIKGSDGKLRMVGVGDVIGEEGTVAGSKKRGAGKRKKDAGYEVRVVELAKDRIVLEQQTPEGPEMIVIRLVNGKQTVERITKRPPKQPAMPAQVSGPERQK